jgi:cobalt-zinc-cadmium efflux system membrane fusion protein
VVVPTEAVQFDRGTHYVFVREQDRFRSAVVKVGAREGRVTEIVSGLSEGMEIATSGSHVLKAQMQLLAAVR